MTGVRKPTKILALPVLRRKWLYAVEETVEDLKTLPSWRTGGSVAEQAKLGQAQLVQEADGFSGMRPQVHKRILKQWEDLKQAPAGSIKNRVYRLAQGVLDQEDVSETFLKGLPSTTDRYDVLYPSGLPERYVRRRLRLFLRQQEGVQKCRAITWAVAAVPMVPLMLLPFPNVPLYYAGYRAYSHNKALRGCKRLLESMQHTSAAGVSPAAAGVRTAATGASPAVAGAATREADASASGAAAQHGAGEASGGGGGSGKQQSALVYLLPEEELARLVHANKQRAEEEPALDPDGAATIGERFGFPDLTSLLGRLLKGVGVKS